MTSSVSSSSSLSLSSLSYVETFQKVRDQAKKSTDPVAQLNYVKYLLQASKLISISDHIELTAINSTASTTTIPDSATIISTAAATTTTTDKQQFSLVPSTDATTTGATTTATTNPTITTTTNTTTNTTTTTATVSQADLCKETTRRMFEAEAIKWLKKLATQGVGSLRQPLADAQFLLAEYYGKGAYGLSTDHAKAFMLYIQASKQNHSTATYRAAVCYELGAGTKQDYDRAVQFYRKASALGEALAMHKLALVLLYGKLHQKKNLKEGIKWLKRAAGVADELHPEALHDLAQCHEKQGGCPVVIPDESYAFELYSRAANFGYAPSQYRLGTFYEYGIYGCQVDSAYSIKWYTKAADQGYAEAELALSGWYLSGAEGVLTQSDTEALAYARKAADKNHPKAEFMVGHFYEIGIGIPEDLSQAITWYKRSAAHGNKRALQRLVELKVAAGRKCIIM